MSRTLGLILLAWFGPAVWLWRRAPFRATVSSWPSALVVSGATWWATGSMWLGLGCGVALFGGRLVRRLRATAVERTAGLDEVTRLIVLLELCLHGGVSLRRAFIEVVPWLDGPLRVRCDALVASVEQGSGLADQLDALVRGPHPELDGLCRVVRAVELDGAPIGPALAALVGDAQLQRRHRLERSARRLPLRLLAPLMVGVLPAFVLLAVMPMLASAIAGLRTP